METLFETLMRRMDAINQAIASLRSQPSVPEVVLSGQSDKPWGAGAPPKETFPMVKKRWRGQKRGKGAVPGQAEKKQPIHVQGMDRIVTPEGLAPPQAPPLQTVVQSLPVLTAAQPASVSTSQVTIQVTTKSVTGMVVVGGESTATAGVSHSGVLGSRTFRVTWLRCIHGFWR
ncbi:hypothetical protein NDU88_001212 [Pleurodeles waltl]|uniref:Uncharacterized protein n=1 Tax=Pleurodeles waltl TaxID=8319 RepID=A0AAV7LF96_PLEWA|nr:hypothetical protein NDU88_001212 [Pleurodeles waltl]